MPVKLKAGVVIKMRVSRIERDTKQPRQTFDEAPLKALADSMKIRQEVPIKVRVEGKRIIIVDGERRWRAAKIAKLEYIDVLVDERSDALDIAATQLTTAVQREHLSPLDIAEFLVDLQKREKANTNTLLAALAKRGITEIGPAKLERVMRLVDLPDWGKEYVRKGVFGESHGAAVLQVVRFPAVLKQLRGQIANDISWKGGITVKELVSEVERAVRVAGTDLNQKYGQEEDQRHFPIEQCLKCEFYIKIGGGQYCQNRKLFDKKNREALLLKAEKEAKKQEKAKGNGREREEPVIETDPTKVEPRKVKFVDANVVSMKGVHYDRARPLDDAGFDKTQCNGCPHRHLASANGKADHEDGVEDHCFYPPCFEHKSASDSRVQGRRQKMREYLEAWLRPVVVREAPARLNAKQRAGVLLWLATGAVDRGSAFYGGQMHEHAARATVAFLQKHQLKSFPLLMEFATAKLAEDHERHLVALAVQVMTREQLRWFARYIAIDLNDPAFAYRIDEGYLRLKRKAEIIELWNTSAMSSKLEPNLSTSQLRDWCLEVNARQKIGVPADIQALYDETEETRVDEDEDDLLDEDDQTVCIGCGCSDFDACPDGCSWVVQGDRRGYMPGGNVGVCSNPACAPHMERFRRRDFTLSEVAEKRVAERDKRRKQDDEQLAEAGGELGEILAAGKKRRMPREV